MIIEFILRLLLGDEFTNEADNNKSRSHTEVASDTIDNTAVIGDPLSSNFELMCQRLEQNDPTMEFVNLTNYYMNPLSAESMFIRLGHAIEQCTSLKKLKLHGDFSMILFRMSCNNSISTKSAFCHIHQGKAQQIFRQGLAQNNSLEYLDISGHPLLLHNKSLRNNHRKCCEWIQLLLSNTHRPRSLQELVLSRCQISDQHILSIIDRGCDDGDDILRSNNNVSSSSSRSSSSLLILDLSKNEIRHLTFCLSTVLRLHPNLQILDLSFNCLGKKEENTVLEEEEKKKMKMEEQEENATLLLSSSSNLSSLNLSNNHIGCRGHEKQKSAEIIRSLNDSLLKLERLTNLNLSWNDIGDDGIIVLADRLQQIRKVDLTHCSITSKGSCYLANVLRNQQQVRNQKKNNNNNDDSDASNSSYYFLKELCLSRNGLGDDGVLPFIQYETSLKSLDIRITSFTGGGSGRWEGRDDNNNEDDVDQLHRNCRRRRQKLITKVISKNTNLCNVMLGNRNLLGRESLKIKREVQFWTKKVNATGLRRLVLSHNEHQQQRDDDDGDEEEDHSTGRSRKTIKGHDSTTIISTNAILLPPPPYSFWPYIIVECCKDSPSALYYMLRETPELMMMAATS